MKIPDIPYMTYKYWLFKNKQKDSYEAWDAYYREIFPSVLIGPNWLVEATIREGYKTRFINL